MRAAAISVFVFVGLGSLAIATQTVASIFRDQPALGAPILRLQGAGVYWPWSIVGWSQQWRALYPRPFVLADFILMCGCSLGAIGAIAADAAGIPRLRRHGENGWADFADVKDAGLFAHAGAVLGKFAGEILTFDAPGHLLLVGASRSGKGRGHVVPTLLAWPHSALVLDIKGELADGDRRHAFPGTAGFRETLGPVLRFAPTHAASARFNPLFEVRKGANEVRDVQNIVEIIVDPAGDGRHEDFWDRSAKQVLVGLILHVLYCEPDHRKTLAVVREKLRDLDAHAQQMRLVLHRRSPETGRAGNPSRSPARRRKLSLGRRAHALGHQGDRGKFLRYLRRSAGGREHVGFGFPRRRSHVRRKAGHALSAAAAVGRRPADAVDAPHPQPDHTRADGESDLRRLGSAKRTSFLLLLDEFPQLGRLPFFETAMGAFAGYGLKAYLVCQSLNHVTRAYGRDSVILDNCHVVTAFAAADIETAKTIAAMAGERWEMVEQESVARPRRAADAPRAPPHSAKNAARFMLPADVRQLPDDEQIIFVAGRKADPRQEASFRPGAHLSAPGFGQRRGSARRLTTAHDWVGVRPLGQLVKDKKTRSEESADESLQGDLFRDPKHPSARRWARRASKRAAAPRSRHLRRRCKHPPSAFICQSNWPPN